MRHRLAACALAIAKRCWEEMRKGAGALVLSSLALGVVASEETQRGVSRRGYRGDPVEANIQGVTRPARIGDAIRIGGSGFGVTAGRVVVVVDDWPGVTEVKSTSGTGREVTRKITRRPLLVDCPVSRWAETEIRVTLPEALGVALARQSTTRATLWVKLAGGELGPTTPLEVGRESLTPRITSVSPDPASPGQELRIEGENFFAWRPLRVGDEPGPMHGGVNVEYRGRAPDEGTVYGFGYLRSGGTNPRARSGGSRPRREILEWQDTSIRVRLPEDLRALRGPMEIVVRNAGGLEDSVAATFEPAQETREICRDELDLRFERRNRRYESQEIRDLDGIVLLNDWQVVRVRGYLGRSGLRLASDTGVAVSGPAPASSRLALRYRAWAVERPREDAYARACVEVQGPSELFATAPPVPDF